MEKEELDNGELISMIRLRGLKPSQVFKTDEIMEDPRFKKAIEAEVDYKLWSRDQDAEEKLNKQMDEEIKREEKLKEENELIPGGPYYEINHKEKGKKKEDDNPLIPDDSDEGEKSDNDLIPD